MSTRTKRYGMTIPLHRTPLHAQRDWIQDLEDRGYTDVWSSEAYGVDGFTPLALAACWAPRLRLGCACFPVHTRGPAVLAMSSAALAQAAPGRFVMGIGASSPTVVQAWNGIAYEAPFARVRDTARFLRAAWAGEKINGAYSTFSVEGFRLGVEVDPQPPLFIAALRPGMLRLAAREGDGVLLNWISVEDVAHVVRIVKEVGRDVEIALRVLVCPMQDLDQAREVCRYAVTGSLTVPAYRAHQEWLGRGDRLRGMWRQWDQGDRKGALAAIPDSVIDELIVCGPPERCREHLQRFFDAGVDTLIVALMEHAVDARQASRDLALSR